VSIRVNPKVLRWARDARLLSLEQAAERLNWSTDRVVEVEQATEISLEELEKLASSYRLSTATLLMPEPLPADQYPPRAIDDFRLHSHIEAEPLTFATQIKVENAFELMELLSEVNDEDVNVAPRPLLPTADIAEEAERVAIRERGRIAPPVDAQIGWETDKEAFLRWREAIEAQDIIVQKTTLHEASVRGFAIFARGYGFMAVDSGDDYRARIFTLLHEYAHLLLRTSGISDQNRHVKIERWCNQFAAAFLMPAAAFKRQYELICSEGPPASEHQVRKMANCFNVSLSSVAIRFEELGLAPRGFYEALKREWGVRKPRRGGGPSDLTQIDIELGRLGTTRVSAIGLALDKGLIDHIEAHHALDVPLEHLPALTAAARARHRAYGPTR
jgi:Zn-dependent peptidase ImmA (M78 family)